MEIIKKKLVTIIKKSLTVTNVYSLLKLKKNEFGVKRMKSFRAAKKLVLVA